MAKIYVSSTILDLESERRAVMEWLVARGHQPVHSYRPDSETVRESCLDDVGTCDLYVLILGHRYGFQPEEANPEKLSITHFEFRRAGQSGIPRIALLRTSVPDYRLSDLQDPQRASLVWAFRAEVEREVRPTEFSDLKGLIQGLSTGVESELDKKAGSAVRLVADALVGIPHLKWRRGISSPGALLRADIDGPVPFHGRDKETEDISAWCNEDRNIGVRLYTGAGGMGKTRLFIEQCKRLPPQDWHAGFLDKQANAACQEVWEIIVRQDRSLFLVVDYAETRREELVQLLRHVFRAAEEHPIRIVLLARAAGVPGDWWDELKAEGDGVGDLLSGPAAAHYSLGPLAMTREDRETSYWKAVANFCKILEKPTPTEPPKDIDAEYYQRVLLLHMSALAMIEGVEVEGVNGILDHVLRRERRFWKDIATKRGLPETVLPGLGQAMAAITLGGGAINESVAVATLERTRFLEGQLRDVLIGIASLFHEVYPGGKWIEPIQPDLLAEHLVSQERMKDPDTLDMLIFGPRDD